MLFKIDIYPTELGTNLVICTGTDYLNPFSLLKEIREEWVRLYNSKPTEMIFDMYYTNGNSDNRFAKMYFDGDKFDSNTFSIIDANNIDKNIIRHQNEIFTETKQFYCKELRT